MRPEALSGPGSFRPISDLAPVNIRHYTEYSVQGAFFVSSATVSISHTSNVCPHPPQTISHSSACLDRRRFSCARHSGHFNSADGVVASVGLFIWTSFGWVKGQRVGLKKDSICRAPHLYSNKLRALRIACLMNCTTASNSLAGGGPSRDVWRHRSPFPVARHRGGAAGRAGRESL